MPFQIKNAKKVCPQKDTPRNSFFLETKKFSSNKRGKKAKKSSQPGKPSQARLRSTPVKTDKI
jgi:hypothetical protein